MAGSGQGPKPGASDFRGNPSSGSPLTSPLQDIGLYTVASSASCLRQIPPVWHNTGALQQSHPGARTRCQHPRPARGRRAGSAVAPLHGRRARPAARRRCRDTEGRRRWKRRRRGGRDGQPHLLHRSQSRQPTPPLPERVRRVRSAPGRRRVALPVPGVRSTAAGTPRPRLPPPRSGCPSRLGSGRACPGMPLASALAWLAPLAGGDVQCQRAAHWGQALERRSGDKGNPGSTTGTPTSCGVVAQGTLRGAVTTHATSLSFQLQHAAVPALTAPSVAR